MRPVLPTSCRRQALAGFATVVVAALSACGVSTPFGGAESVRSPDFDLKPVFALPTPTNSTIYVGPGGDDSAPGTSDAPLASIAAAASRAEPGSTVWVRNGTYESDVQTEANGSDGARIAFVAESPQVKLVGAGSGGAAWLNSGDYVDIVGFDISGQNEDGIYNRGSHVRIMNNQVYGFPTGNCIATGNNNYDLTDIDVIGNVVHGCGNNELDHGIYTGHARGVVSNNIAYGNPGFGIHCWQACTDLIVTNNLVFDNQEGGIVVGADNENEVPADNTLVANNLIVGNGRQGIREGGDTGSGNRYVNNLMWDNEQDRILIMSGKESGTIVADPQFVDFQRDGSGDYRLQPGSPGVNAGSPELAPPVAIDGTPRPLAGTVDLGVYEQ